MLPLSKKSWNFHVKISPGYNFFDFDGSVYVPATSVILIDQASWTGKIAIDWATEGSSAGYNFFALSPNNILVADQPYKYSNFLIRTHYKPTSKNFISCITFFAGCLLKNSFYV